MSSFDLNFPVTLFLGHLSTVSSVFISPFVAGLFPMAVSVVVVVVAVVVGFIWLSLLYRCSRDLSSHLWQGVFPSA